MKVKDLLELKKLKQEIALIREAKNYIGHSLEWYRESKEVIEKQYNLLKNQLEWNEEKMKEAEKWITSILDNYQMAMCSFFRCRDIKLKEQMKYIPWDSEKFKGNEWFCDDNCYQKRMS